VAKSNRAHPNVYKSVFSKLYGFRCLKNGCHFSKAIAVRPQQRRGDPALGGSRFQYQLVFSSLHFFQVPFSETQKYAKLIAMAPFPQDSKSQPLSGWLNF
jgi:hypothetical protein